MSTSTSKYGATIPTKRHPYHSQLDKYQMAALAARFFADNMHVVDLPYRLSSWALDDPENAALWFNEKQELVGWAVLQTPFWTIDYAYHPAAAGLLPEILDWADQRARQVIDTPYGRPAWFVNAFKGQAERAQALEAAGFECQADVGENSWSKVLLCRSLQTPVKVYNPPAGFTVRPLAGENEAAAYVELHQTVFESKNMTLEWRQRTLQHPDYTPELDIVVEAPDGRLAAFCICWLDRATGSAAAGHVEPLGCHPDFRRYALGRVALSHGLQRLQAHGAQQIYVETDSYRNTAYRLYEFFDFELLQDVQVFRKDYDQPRKQVVSRAESIVRRKINYQVIDTPPDGCTMQPSGLLF